MVVPPVVIMPKPVAARPATVESSAMIERCRTGLVRLKSAPRVVVSFRRCQAATNDFFFLTDFSLISPPSNGVDAGYGVEFFA